MKSKRLDKAPRTHQDIKEVSGSAGVKLNK